MPQHQYILLIYSCCFRATQCVSFWVLGFVECLRHKGKIFRSVHRLTPLRSIRRFTSLKNLPTVFTSHLVFLFLILQNTTLTALLHAAASAYRQPYPKGNPRLTTCSSRFRITQRIFFGSWLIHNVPAVASASASFFSPFRGSRCRVP